MDLFTGLKLRFRDDKMKMKTLMFTDTQCDDQFAPARLRRYSLANVCMICFACDHVDSFHSVKRQWAKEIQSEYGDIPIVLVATKVDLRPQTNEKIFEVKGSRSKKGKDKKRDKEKETQNKEGKFVWKQEGEQMCQEIDGLAYAECSVMEWESVQILKTHLITAALAHFRLTEQEL